jgi:hypothetical protein
LNLLRRLDIPDRVLRELEGRRQWQLRILAASRIAQMLGDEIALTQPVMLRGYQVSRQNENSG